jgi:hypothetical protein
VTKGERKWKEDKIDIRKRENIFRKDYIKEKIHLKRKEKKVIKVNKEEIMKNIK